MINILPIILKKKAGKILNRAEFTTIVEGYINQQINTESMAALYMVFCFQKLTDEEVLTFFDVVYENSKKIDLSSIFEFKIDKHSSGGIGDKITIGLIPLLMSLNIKFYKFSGKRLAYTGGTIDKLSSIPNLKLEFSISEFEKLAQKNPVLVSNVNTDTSEFERKSYLLRNQTGSLESTGLIAISIMIKKILLNTDAILLDLKIGQGAVFKRLEDSLEFVRLAKLICKKYNRKIKIIFSDMNEPLGFHIGNKFEILEILDLLKNPRPSRLKTLLSTLAANAVVLKDQVSFETALKQVEQQWLEADLIGYFKQFIKYQSGDFAAFMALPIPQCKIVVKASMSGYFKFINLVNLGNLFNLISVDQKNVLDVTSGIKLCVSNGQKVTKGDKLFELYTNFSYLNFENLITIANSTYKICQEPFETLPIVLKTI